MNNNNQSESLLYSRRRRVLKIVAATVALIGLLSFTFTTISLIGRTSKTPLSPSTLISASTGFITIVIGLVGYQMARLDKLRWLNVGSYIITGAWTLVIFASVLVSSFNALTLSAMLLPMLCAGLLLSAREIIMWLIGLLLLLTLAFVLTLTDVTPSDVSDATLYTNYIFFALVLSVLGGSLWYLQVNVRSILNEINQRMVELARLSDEREQKRQFGENVSTQLKSMTAELSTTTSQQTSRSQEQARAVMEVTTSLAELGQTARQIAVNSNRVSAAASNGLNSAQEVRQTSERATISSSHGKSAVTSSIRSIEEVREGITALAERLMTLTERSKEISSIITFIKEIADETHLLGLNAAIESAGAGEGGQRFAVVAAEVKNLADRSLTATKEVGTVIAELQGAVAAAVLASEETRKKTYSAVERSNQAGEVINELGQVVAEASTNSIQIVEAVRQIAMLADEISLATRQQESAVSQIVATMEGVGVVAQENASAVLQVSATVNQIDELSTKLKTALNSAELEMALA